MSRAVGIDLGTTNSVVSVLEGGEPVVISNAGGVKQYVQFLGGGVVAEDRAWSTQRPSAWVGAGCRRGRACAGRGRRGRPGRG